MAGPNSIITNLTSASNNHILATLSNQKVAYSSRKAWINLNNRYINDTSAIIKADFINNTVSSQELVEYISSSIFIHCFNAWSYLSAAINSLLEGDYPNAIHNAYYAELRTIMSFLASQGVGVFNGNNVLVNSNGTVDKILPDRIPTHQFAKSAFDQWLSEPANLSTLLTLLKINNSSLKDWLDAFGWSQTSNFPGTIAKTWLETWSVDMSVINDEKDFRNFVSYNPQCFDQSIAFHSDNIKTRLEFVDELWRLCAPEGLFSNSILRLSLETLAQPLYSKTLNNLDETTEWNPIFNRLGMSPQDQKRAYYKSFFDRKIESNDNLTFFCAKNNIFSNPIIESDGDPMGIISRATLLLLFNTMINESILRLTGISKAHLKFWLDNIGIKLGFWESNKEPYLFSDLWDDTWIEMDEIKQWIKNTQISHSPFTFKKDLKLYTHSIKNFNKSFLWNAGL